MDLEQSWLDCETGRLEVVMTEAGVVESLLQLCLSSTAGLSLSGWLESEGRPDTWNCLETGGAAARQMRFSVSPGVDYQLGRYQLTGSYRHTSKAHSKTCIDVCTQTTLHHSGIQI